MFVCFCITKLKVLIFKFLRKDCTVNNIQEITFFKVASFIIQSHKLKFQPLEDISRRFELRLIDAFGRFGANCLILQKRQWHFLNYYDDIYSTYNGVVTLLAFQLLTHDTGVVKRIYDYAIGQPIKLTLNKIHFQIMVWIIKK